MPSSCSQIEAQLLACAASDDTVGASRLFSSMFAPELEDLKKQVRIGACLLFLELQIL